MAGTLAGDANHATARAAAVGVRRMLTSAEADRFLLEVLKATNVTLEEARFEPETDSLGPIRQVQPQKPADRTPGKRARAMQSYRIAKIRFLAARAGTAAAS